jgi:hypothetical protein
MSYRSLNPLATDYRNRLYQFLASQSRGKKCTAMISYGHNFEALLPCKPRILTLQLTSPLTLTSGSVISWCILCKSVANELTLFKRLQFSLSNSHTDSSALWPKTWLEYLSHIPTLKGELSCRMAPLDMPTCTIPHSWTQSEVLWAYWYQLPWYHLSSPWSQ